MLKILIDENIPYIEKIFKELGTIIKVPGRDISSSMLFDIDALIIRSITKVDENLLKNSNVKFVGSVTSGTDHVDKVWLQNSGIEFFSSLGCNANAVSEYVFSSLLWLAEKYNFFIRDKTVGIIGVGNIGKKLYEKLSMFGINTILCDPPLQNSGNYGNWKSIEYTVKHSDILTVHVPLIEEGKYKTKHLINEELLSELLNEKYIINTSRGEVIDNCALLKVLRKGKKIKVILDVWEKEPNILLPLLDFIDIGTAHIAGYTVEGKINGIVQLFNAYNKFLDKNIFINPNFLLPLPKIQSIKLHGSISQKLLNLLISLIYDISQDDLKFRREINCSNGFDRIRNSYYARREWSSVSIETDNMDSRRILYNLGFNVQE